MKSNRTLRGLAMGAIRDFLAARRANVAVIFALAALPLVATAALGIDYSTATAMRNRLQAAADAAALAAIAVKSPAAIAAQKMTGDGPVAVGETDGKQIFLSNLSAADKAGLTDVSVSVTKVGNQLKSSVNFSGQSPNALLPVIGKITTPVGGSAVGAHVLAQFAEYYILIDNTPSMGIAATASDIAIMQAKTGCAFACHDMSDSSNAYNKARALGVNLRIDVVRMAVKKLTQTAAASVQTGDQFRMGVYTFGTSATAMGLTTIIAPNSDMNLVNQKASAVDLMTIPYQGFNDDQVTDFPSTLAQMNQILTTSGDGSTSDTRQKILFFVSDGVNDGIAPSNGCTKPIAGKKRCQAPIDVALAACKAIKAKGIKIAALYTTYVPLPSNSWYNQWISPFQSQIGAKMEACASPGLYYEVSPNQGIDSAMNALFQKSLNMVQLAR